MERRSWIIGGAIGLTTLALAALSAGLSDLELSGGRPLPDVEVFPSQSSTAAPAADSPLVETLMRVALAIVFWVLLPISLVYLVLSPKARRVLLRNLAVFASLLIMFYLIVQLASDRGSPGSREPPLGDRLGQPADGALRSVEPPAFVSQPPDWMVLVVSGLVFAIIGLIGWWMWQGRAGTQAPEDDLEDQLAQQAGSALDAIRSGQEPSNVVLRCYRDMERSVKRAHGLSRRASMTPREFERRLVDAGLDAEAVRELTRLFERVRYGNDDVDARAEAEAEACLAKIAGRVTAGEPV